MMRPTSIVDRHGRPLAYDFFQAGTRPQRIEQPTRFYYSAHDTKDLLPTGSWRQMLSSARFLFANVPIIRGALLEQTLYSFPIEARYLGKDKKWGTIAEQWLYDWKQTANVRGHPYDAQTVSRIRCLGTKIDGDIFTLLTFDQDTEYPRTQIIRAHRIGSRMRDGEIKDGPYKGRVMCNGVVHDERGAAMAYLLLGDKPEEDRWLPASGVIHTYRPDYADEFRGITHLCASIRSMADQKRLREYEMRAMQIQSAYAIQIKNETGFADEAARALGEIDDTGYTAGDAATLTTETLEDGLVKYFRAGTGSGIEMLRPDRPGEGWQQFEERIIAAALYGIEWDPNFALAIKEPGGAWARTVLEKVNRCIENNVAVESQTQRREDAYALSRAVELGILPQPSDGNIFAWEYQLGRPKLTADLGRESQARAEAYKLGTTTLRELATERGFDWEEIRSQRQFEALDKLRRAREIQQQYPELSLRECIDLLEQWNPNGAPAQPAEADGGPDDITLAKMEMDAYGVGVRAGTITPNDDDERYFRGKLKLPAQNGNVGRSWSDDGGVRRPITITPAPGQGKSQPFAQPVEDEDIDE